MRPLQGITVVDLTRYLPGPYCTRVLADFGASIVKVETPPGDPMRGIAWYDRLNAGKEIVVLDLRSAQGREELYGLLGRADVCIEGFRPSTSRDIGVDAASLSARFPALLHCSISGYGAHGGDRAAHDINYQAEAGLLRRDPRVPPLLVADITGALHAAIAILAALAGRRMPPGSSGTRDAAEQPRTLDVSLFDAARSWADFLPPPVLSGQYACYNVYETADARHVALGALEPKFWDAFCRSVGRGAWSAMQFAADPVRTRLLADVAGLFRSRTQREWVRALSGVDCCFSAVARE